MAINDWDIKVEVEHDTATPRGAVCAQQAHHDCHHHRRRRRRQAVVNALALSALGVVCITLLRQTPRLVQHILPHRRSRGSAPGDDRACTDLVSDIIDIAWLVERLIEGELHSAQVIRHPLAPLLYAVGQERMPDGVQRTRTNALAHGLLRVYELLGERGEGRGERLRRVVTLSAALELQCEERGCPHACAQHALSAFMNLAAHG